MVFRARTIARWFVLADVVSFVVQAVGGVMAGPGNDPVLIKRGLDIYTGGSALQQGFIFVFVGLMVLFQRRCNQVENIGSPDETGPVKRSWKPLLYGLYGVLLFITVSLPNSLPYLYLTICQPPGPNHLPHSRIRPWLRAREPNPLSRRIHLRPGLFPHDGGAAHPRHLPPGSVPRRAGQRVPQGFKEGEKGIEDG